MQTNDPLFLFANGEMMGKDVLPAPSLPPPLYSKNKGKEEEEKKSTAHHYHDASHHDEREKHSTSKHAKAKGVSLETNGWHANI